MFALYGDFRCEHNIFFYSLFRPSPQRVEIFSGNQKFPFCFRWVRDSKKVVLDGKLAI